MESKKHAYLIMAHTDFYLLQQLLEVLDDKRNDIYVHIDKKVIEFDSNALTSIIRNANIFFVERINVSWGGDTQIKCEYNLLKAAYPKHYKYYHLISGIDFPIKSQNYIHDFFEKNDGTNYIDVSLSEEDNMQFANQRIAQYHFLQNITGRKDSRIHKLELKFIDLQKKLGINRLKNCPKRIYKGANWFSLTDAMVQEVLQEEKFVKKYCYYSECADEIFLTTIVMNSGNKNVITNNCLRLIDWERGTPYTFQLNDYDTLMESDMLFARKFSSETDGGKKLIKSMKDKIISN